MVWSNFEPRRMEVVEAVRLYVMLLERHGQVA
jgi:hypothetical protein